jgi:hypothetical protein
MTRAALLDIGILAALVGAGTWFGGWWAIPPLAALWQLLRRNEPSWRAGLAAALAWGILIAREPWGALGRLTGRVSGVFHLPPGGVLLLALGFAWLLAWSAARLVRPLRAQ